MRKKEIQEIAEHCWNVLVNWYDLEAPMPDYYVSKVASHAKYLPLNKRIRIVDNPDSCLTWNTYNRKTVGKTALNVYIHDIRHDIELQFIHEMTHHIQQLQGRQYSEVETTQNEIDYAEIEFPYLYNQLTEIPKDIRLQY